MGVAQKGEPQVLLSQKSLAREDFAKIEWKIQQTTKLKIHRPVVVVVEAFWNLVGGRP